MKKILKSYWFVVPFVITIVSIVIYISDFNRYLFLLFNVSLLSFIFYRKIRPLILGVVLIGIFFGYVNYVEAAPNITFEDLRYLLLSSISTGILSALCILVLPFGHFLGQSKEQTQEKAGSQQLEDRIKVSDVIFLNTIIDTMEKDSILINDLISINGGRLREQVNQSHEIMLSSVELQVFFDEIQRSVNIIKSMSERSIESAMIGKSMLLKMQDEISRLLGTMEKTTGLITNLGHSTQTVNEIINNIENVADQTNLLALNATIEAARAGDEGYSFAVVAEEIGKLADTTQRSTRNVIDMIESIRTSTEVAQEVVPKESSQAKVIIDNANGTMAELETILDAVEFLTDQTHDLAIESNKQLERSKNLNTYIDNIARFIRDSSGDIAGIYDHTDTLEIQSDAMRKIVNKLKFDERIENPAPRFYEYATEFVKECEKAFEDGIANGKITEEALFSRTYSEFGNYSPPKYRSEFDRFTDEVLSPILEKYLAMDARLDYFALTDDNGYCPTHNKKYGMNLQDASLDKTQNRTKRIFNDPIGKKAAKNTEEKYLIQMYPRDTGDFINDLSVPFLFRGRHWGAVRIGFTFVK